MNRDDTIRQIRSALQRRSGKAWSVTGGRGTAWGWIRIDAPPRRCTWRHRLKVGHAAGAAGLEHYDDVDTGQPGGHMSPADRAELARLLALERVHEQGVSVAASSDYYREYLERAEGRPPSVIARPYWD